ncbi:unnamed protein product [Ranitomeya imitator]|uniref:Actin-related protein 6 n=1 Tax=Ranitomeya imitator TaxID=111125 RepID=A0ABN9KUQ2_9NEOB|nr:unnamed protein product [Ranitomeya imitator]
MRRPDRRCSDTDNDPDRCSVAVWSLESCHTDRSPATNDAGNQGKHRPVQEESRAQRRGTDSGRPGMTTLVLDNGAYTAKIGYSNGEVRSSTEGTVRECVLCTLTLLPYILLIGAALKARCGNVSSVHTDTAAIYPANRSSTEGTVRECVLCTLTLLPYILLIGAALKTSITDVFIFSVIPNCQFRSKTARLKTFTANQIDEVKDPSGLFYILPFQKGYLVNWDVQRQVWDYLFGKEMFQVDFVESNIIITEPYFNFSSIQESMNEILFEEYQFQAALRVNPGALSAHRYFHDNPSELCCIIVDTGYSFTHIVPYCRSKKKQEGIIRDSIATGSVPQDWRIANVVPIFKKGSKSEPGNYKPHGFMRNRSCQTNLISFYEEVSYRLDHGESLDVVYLDFSKAFDTVPHKRINVGGKLLTNHLKEIISYRQLHVMDETHVINQVKEDVCYVAADFYKDMEVAKLKGEDNSVMVDYVLPDFSTIKKGFVKVR